jgi:hypothetical protein
LQLKTAAIGGGPLDTWDKHLVVHTGIVALEEARQRRLRETHALGTILEVTGLNLASIDQGEDNGVHNNGTPFLHQVRGEGGVTALELMKEALVGIEANNVNGGIEMVVEQRISSTWKI